MNLPLLSKLSKFCGNFPVRKTDISQFKYHSEISYVKIISVVFTYSNGEVVISARLTKSLPNTMFMLVKLLELN